MPFESTEKPPFCENHQPQRSYRDPKRMTSVLECWGHGWEWADDCVGVGVQQNSAEDWGNISLTPFTRRAVRLSWVAPTNSPTPKSNIQWAAKYQPTPRPYLMETHGNDYELEYGPTDTR